MDVLLSRDLDSRVSAREVAAVREWLGSGRAVHSMRDHPTHWVPMLGSAWAARLDTPGARARWAETWRTILGGQDSLATSLVYADRWDTAATGGSAPPWQGGAGYAVLQGGLRHGPDAAGAVRVAPLGQQGRAPARQLQVRPVTKYSDYSDCIVYISVCVTCVTMFPLRCRDHDSNLSPAALTLGFPTRRENTTNNFVNAVVSCDWWRAVT